MAYLESKFYSILDEMTTVVILHVLWIISILLIITAIPATIALFATVRRKLIYKTNAVTGFYFKQVFKYIWKGNLIGLPVLLILFSLSFYPAVLVTGGENWFVYAGVTAFIVIIFMLYVIHLLVMHIHFQQTFKQWLKESFYLTFYKLHYSLAIVFSVSVVIFVSLQYPILLLLCSVSVTAYICVFIIIKKIFSLELKKMT